MASGFHKHIISFTTDLCLEGIFNMNSWCVADLLRTEFHAS